MPAPRRSGESPKLTNAKPWLDQCRTEKRRWRAYNEQPAYFVDSSALPTTETNRQGDLVFTTLLAALVKGYKIGAKQAFFRLLFHTAKVALYHGGVIAYTRNKNDPGFSEANIQVIEAAVKAKLFDEERSPPGSPKMSRLIPTKELAQFASADPWTFDPNSMKQFVYLREQDTGREVPFDPKHPTATKYQRRLERINQVNSGYKITYEARSPEDETRAGERQLRPVLYALFTGDFDHHGRLYTGRYGHQGLRKLERATIRFDGEGCIELDYSGLHPRLLYHLEGIDYRGDPYALWGRETTESLRLLAKVYLNALINATDPSAAASACNRAMSHKTKEGKWKEGKSYDEAVKLLGAYRRSGIKFHELHQPVLDTHPRIRHHFGTGAGLRLMRMDSIIALDVLFHFTKRSLPCLSCHDSFIVTEREGRELRTIMGRMYEKHAGFLPIIH
jgi:hypothetical protein